MTKEYNTLSLVAKVVIIGMSIVSISLLAFVHFTSKPSLGLECLDVAEQAQLLMKFRQTGMEQHILVELVYSEDKDVQRVNRRMIPLVYETPKVFSELAKGVAYEVTFDKALKMCERGEI